MTPPKIHTRYQRMSLAMRLAGTLRNHPDAKVSAVAGAIYYVLAAPLVIANGYLAALPELAEIVAEVGKEKSRI